MTLAGEAPPRRQKEPKITVALRIHRRSKAAIMALGDEAAKRFGEGSRPDFTEIGALLWLYALNDPTVRRQVASALVQKRISR